MNDEEFFAPGPYGDYLFAGGRVTPGKRQHLLIEAARLAGPECRLIIAGPADDETYARKLQGLVEEHDLAGRVKLQLRMHSRAEIGELATNALAGVYIPFREDSLGYVTMEAFASARAIVTTTDSGGLLEIVRDDTTGIVCQPDAQSIATSFDRLFSNRALARELGAAARDLWTMKKIGWAHTLERLLS